MDRLDALVAIAHLRLRLVMIERNPKLLERIPMPIEIKRPMELAGLRSRLARARQTEAAIEVTGKRYDGVLDRIDELHEAARGNVGHLEGQESELRRLVEAMTGGSNGGPNGGETFSIESSEVGQIISGEPEGTGR